MIKGNWHAGSNDTDCFVQNYNVDNDRRIVITGEFESIEDKLCCAKEIARRMNVALSDETAQKLQFIGNGSVSAGIRIAADFYIKLQQH